MNNKELVTSLETLVSVRKIALLNLKDSLGNTFDREKAVQLQRDVELTLKFVRGQNLSGNEFERVKFHCGVMLHHAKDDFNVRVFSTVQILISNVKKTIN